MLKENIDEIDLKILRILIEDAKVSYGEIGEKVFLSPGAVHTRVKKMETTGIITGSSISVDTKKLGWDIAAFLGIYLEKSEQYDDVAAQLKIIPEIVSINYTTGNYSIFVKLMCRDTAHLRNVLHDKIQKVQGIQRTETFISLEESLSRTAPII
ncbi:Lrp/AsnC ligand binding domain-containing protein [Lacihabitans soyangensis]|jgi:Lrp/AsnC family transcriptional regulator, regulator for asnA, asnC and gidA|uniref:Winged helix-turn-helix transcriptional regulator n=1 Tax=Lacihabitans soyangensis TaxID=869394 RepID=A0AAE3KRE5_9BACT|nr:Lrp/AsnC ligand binding domain-containing protein [Lacihabitans soyangensis]MCP9762038.1 winged helix-turn-helix transcriptional regulator [Lacihabitans soyangensis]